MDKERIRSLLLAALPAEAALHAEVLDPQRLYVPQQHVRALLPEVELVVGTRGVGKTVWFESLQDARAIDYVRAVSPRAAGELASVRSYPGFGVALRASLHPSGRVLQRLLAVGAAPEDIWRTVVAHLIAAESVTGSGWSEWSWEERCAWVGSHPEAIDRAIQLVDDRAIQSGEQIVVLFDALDRLSPDWEEVRALTSGLFRVLLDLRGTRRVHGKAFVRPDMLGRLDFPDASKLATNRADLTWPRPALYALLFHLLGNADHPDASWFRAQTGQSWTDVGGVWRLPGVLEGDEVIQAGLLHRITGPYMGRDPRRGKPYTWLTNNLSDERDVVSPRSFLVALSSATRLTAERHAGHDWGIHWQAIKSGVQAASLVRVRELQEDLPWVAEAIDALRGLLLPATETEVLNRWNTEWQVRAFPAVTEPSEEASPVGPDLGRGAFGLLEQVSDLGLIRRTQDGRLNMPEVYRVAFGLGRKGGVARSRTAP